jgi:peptide/nickel transport system substrate-binding protein
MSIRQSSSRARRGFTMSRRRMTAVLLTGLVALIAAGCGSSESSGGGGSSAAGGKSASDTTLTLGYYEDIQSPDPDIQYDIPGLELVNNTYEGLVHYGYGSSTKIEPWLATSWTVTNNDKTYTFQLRPGVVFHDGTPFNAAAMKASIERRIKMKEGTLYQVTDVKSVSAPSQYTLVINLKRTVSAFMDYLASPYGVKAISPTAIAKNQVGGDLGKKWLSTHDAGTGPYTITQFTLGQQYTEIAWSKWWGNAPFYKTVVYKLVPDTGNQVLQLQGGSLDILHQQPITTVASFESKPGFQVKVFPVFLKTWIHVNPNRPPFSNAEVRKALGQAINRELISKTFFQKYGTVSDNMYPAGMMPSGVGTDPQPFDQSKLKAAVAKLSPSERNVNLTYLLGHGVDIQRVADAIGSELRETGLNVTLHEITVAQLFSYPAQNPTKVPDLFVGSENPDSASPDTWARSYMYKGAALNYLAGAVPAADAAMDEGLASTSPAQVTADYGRAGDLLHAEGTFITLADGADTFIARAGITGFEHQLECTTCINLAALKAGK